MTAFSHRRLLSIFSLLFTLSLTSGSSCPWTSAGPFSSSRCACQLDAEDALSIVCENVALSSVLSNVQSHVDRNRVIRLLHVNASGTDSPLEAFGFRDLKIVELTLMDSEPLLEVSANAFRGLEDSLMRLSLINVGLTKLPVEALRPLRLLRHLDLSSNSIRAVEENAFVTLRLNSLTLADNPIDASNFALGAFNGLESSLNTLDLKKCRTKKMPKALHKLGGLLFLDLTENNLVELDADLMATLTSLSALNLENNLIHSLSSDLFEKNGDTLASLSLLNNLITEFPAQALSKLPRLKVLDLGFNLLRSLPVSAFTSTSSLTLLALDGNPMSTLKESSLQSLNGTLRGLSVGSRFLVCDCNLRWILDWMRKYELKVTSRESQPQFCGHPRRLFNKNFYQFTHADLTCGSQQRATPPPLKATPRGPPPTPTTPSAPPTRMTTRRTTTTSTRPTEQRSFRPQVLTKKPKSSDMVVAAIPMRPGEIVTEIKMAVTPKNNRASSPLKPKVVNKSSWGVESPMEKPTLNTLATLKQNTMDTTDIVTRVPRDRPMSETRRSSSSRRSDLSHTDSSSPSLLVRDAYKEENSVVIEWESLRSDGLGFRVVYRLFGKPDFKQGPPLAPSEREFRIKNVPLNECIVVCVVSLSRVSVTPASVPTSQCREIRTEGVGADDRIDWIVVPSSAAIVATVIIALILFIACVKGGQQRSRRELLSEKSLSNLGSLSRPLQPPLATLAALGLPPPGLSTLPPMKELDQLSSYSGRSVPRARMYHTGSVSGGYVPEDARSHISAISARSGRSRSIGDLSGRHAFNAGGTGRRSRNDLRQSRQSLVSVGRRSNRPMDVLNPAYLSPENDDSLEESEDNMSGNHSADNWTDYDQDIYMHRPSKFGNNNRHSRSRHNSFKRYRADDDVNL